ncbi:hypothetical protein [Rhodospirillaceae bacterium SYSU D60014]|uniref:hypothetical protein n=1 Tax=Virgifigura deserti TaxID=2268457 RepID=UPI000E66AA78
MTDTTGRFARPPRSEADILAELGQLERRYNGPHDRSRLLDEAAQRHRWEHYRPRAVLRADLLRYENIRAEHLRWLRISVRQFRAVLRRPDSAGRAHQIAFARDAIQHNKESVRIWSEKVADARAKLKRASFRTVAAE